MAFANFKGGVHPAGNKEITCKSKIQDSKGPDTLYVPLSQHIGAPAKPLVKKDDVVKKGQLIGESGGFVSANIHSPVSGKVKEIKKMSVVGGNLADCIVIENDREENISSEIAPYGDYKNLSAERLLEIVKEIGLVGMGGATFPTHVKLNPPEGKVIETLIINGAECEPFLTADHRLMLEEGEDIINGTLAFMKILGVKKAFIAVEDNKKDAIENLKKLSANHSEIEVVDLKTKYPQGAEKQLIYVVTGKEVPSGGLPADAGAIVDNVATVAQFAKSLRTGMPLIDRVCTITGGAVNEPKNLRIKIGTLYSDIIDECGGFKGEIAKIVSGGPMMGIAVADTKIPSNKGTSGLLCLSEKEAYISPTKNCIRCGKCVEICPMSLEPVFIATYATKGNFDMSKHYYALDCIECGGCSFICPSKRPLVQMIRVAKRQIMAQSRKEKK